MKCVQSWRANCDIQILLYDSDPLYPSPSDIAKATDYIVGYACKGNENLKQERLHMIQLILKAHDTNGDETDVTRIARQILNYTIGEKLISKQEAMVQIAQLRLFHCSETIETHSLSGYRKLTVQNCVSNATLLAKYARRPQNQENLSLNEFFYVNKRIPTDAPIHCIPHFVGASSKPKYPVDEDYARSILMVHRHWRLPFPYLEGGAKDAFDEIIADESEEEPFPPEVTIPYERMKARYERKGHTHEPVTSESYSMPYFNSAHIDEDLKQIIQLASLLPKTTSSGYNDLANMDFGHDYDWSTENYKVRSVVIVLFFFPSGLNFPVLSAPYEFQ